MFAFARNLVKSIDGTNPQNNSNNTPAYGFRVVHVDQNSPASKVGIESLFDYIIAINGRSLTDYLAVDQNSLDFENSNAEEAPIEAFINDISSLAGSSVSLTVWSAKGRVQRDLILPVASPGTGTEDGDLGLGLSLQWSPLSVADHVWHVLNVSVNSPAHQAGLISHSDYIVGAENGLLAAGGEGLLARVVSRMVSSYYQGQMEQTDNTTSIPSTKPESEPPSIELYVYNHDYDTLRPVRIHPNPDWGGSGLLGCGVGYGLLHRLPVVIDKHRRVSSVHHRGSSSFAPGDMLFDASDNNNLFIPAGNMAPSPAAPAVAPRKKPHRHHHGSNAGADLTAYFAEEEKRSHEQDVIRTRADDSLKPPPKASTATDA